MARHESFAETLFFVRAAVLGDPAPAGSRVAGKFSGFPETSSMGRRIPAAAQDAFLDMADETTWPL